MGKGKVSLAYEEDARGGLEGDRRRTLRRSSSLLLGRGVEASFGFDTFTV